MKRCLIALAASIMLALGAGVSAASAGESLLPPLLPPLRQENTSEQQQVQILPIAPQVNLQNVNVLPLGDVEQGDANNANTGQATQQENNQSSGGSSACSSSAQSNDSDQSQVQIVPIAPQVNLQNVNVLPLGDVEQGDANNANTGQATQQKNTGRTGKHYSRKCQSNCGRMHEPKPKPVAKPKPCPEPKPEPCPEPRPEPCPEPKPNPCPEPKPKPEPCPEQKEKPKPCKEERQPKRCPDRGDTRAWQQNFSSQQQVQILPIAPQVNLQNANVLALGHVQQGNANNSNTGQSTQQSNWLGGHALK
jgi:hypothetical protein